MAALTFAEAAVQPGAASHSIIHDQETLAASSISCKANCALSVAPESVGTEGKTARCAGGDIRRLLDGAQQERSTVGPRGRVGGRLRSHGRVSGVSTKSPPPLEYVVRSDELARRPCCVLRSNLKGRLIGDEESATGDVPAKDGGADGRGRRAIGEEGRD
jgi:hypothetical protein